MGAHYRKRKEEKPPPEPAPATTQSPAFGDAAFTERLAVDLAGELMEAFARDYSESGKDHAIAELLFSVRGLGSAYERRVAGTALESIAGRIEAGIREYPHLVRAAETLADDAPCGSPEDNTEHGRASHVARTVLRPLAAKLSRSVE